VIFISNPVNLKILKCQPCFDI